MTSLFCQDVRAQVQPFCTTINGCIFFALISAVVSSIDHYTGHASAINGALLQAMHWIIVVLLAVFYVQPAKCLNPNVEMLWMAYGFLLGEMDSDSIVSWCLIAISATLYFCYQRQYRAEESINIMPAEPEHSEENSIDSI